MMTVFKPKGARVRAVRLTQDNAEQLAETFMGQVNRGPDDFPMNSTDTSENREVVTSVDVPTLEGVKNILMGSWLVRYPDNKLDVMTHEAFSENYEPAYATGRNTTS